MRSDSCVLPRHPTQGRLDPGTGLCYCQYRQHASRRNVHLLHVLRLHRSRPHWDEARNSQATRRAFEARQAHFWRWFDLLHHRIPFQLDRHGTSCRMLPFPQKVVLTHAAADVHQVFMLLNLNPVMSIIANVPAAISSTVRLVLLWVSALTDALGASRRSLPAAPFAALPTIHRTERKSSGADFQIPVLLRSLNLIAEFLVQVALLLLLSARVAAASEALCPLCPS